ncbi:unnamed protein product [Cladocopium goreaui]|uniref:Copia protein n=1 Tax=Cladocopium goreaui TaxID=2562237 RepID=A0A9P1GT08_9DINO|nr:unnamed protein product [Cladocopium goreaui]
MMHNHRDRPFNWQVAFSHMCQETDAEIHVLTKFRQKTKFVRSELITPSSRDDHVKRRRLGKQSEDHHLEDYQNLMTEINQIIPRVGKSVIQEPNILEKLQQMFHDQKIIHVIACRGTDRTLGPPKGMHPEEAPLRKSLILERGTGTIKYEKDWEKWVHLANRQLIRPAHACRINVTMFAKPWPVENDSSQSSQGVNPMPPMPEPASEQPAPSQTESGHADPVTATPLTSDNSERELEEPIMQPTAVMPCDERCFAGHAHREGSSKRETASGREEPDEVPDRMVSHESISQPESEQENSNELPESDATSDTMYLISEDPADSLVVSADCPLAWRCEVDVKLDRPLEQRQPTNEEAWTFLATSAKKQRGVIGSLQYAAVNTRPDIASKLSFLQSSINSAKRVVTSTLSAETTAMAAALDQLAWLRLFWAWLMDPNVQWRRPEEALSKLEPAISASTIQEQCDLAITDCKSLFDLINRTAPPSCSEFRVSLVARAIKEAIKEGIQGRGRPTWHLQLHPFRSVFCFADRVFGYAGTWTSQFWRQKK